MLDPRVVLLLQECFRHAKVIGAWGAGVDALEVAGVLPDEPGVVTGTTPARSSPPSRACWARTACGSASARCSPSPDQDELGGA